MNPIRWRKDRATVEGVKIHRDEWNDSVHLETHDPAVSVTVRNMRGPRKPQVDAAAYALADLVRTLRGME